MESIGLQWSLMNFTYIYMILIMESNIQIRSNLDRNVKPQASQFETEMLVSWQDIARITGGTVMGRGCRQGWDDFSGG